MRFRNARKSVIIFLPFILSYILLFRSTVLLFYVYFNFVTIKFEMLLIWPRSVHPRYTGAHRGCPRAVHPTRQHPGRHLHRGPQGQGGAGAGGVVPGRRQTALRLPQGRHCSPGGSLPTVSRGSVLALKCMLSNVSVPSR